MQKAEPTATPTKAAADLSAARTAIEVIESNGETQTIVDTTGTDTPEVVVITVTAPQSETVPATQSETPAQEVTE